MSGRSAPPIAKITGMASAGSGEAGADPEEVADRQAPVQPQRRDAGDREHGRRCI